MLSFDSPLKSASTVCIEHDAFCANRIDGQTDADEQAFQVVFAGLFDFATFDVDMVDQEPPRIFQAFNVETQRGDILGEFLGILFEGEEDPRLVILQRPMDEKFHGE